MVHVSPNLEDFPKYQKSDENWNIKAFGNNFIKGMGEGDIVAGIKFQGKTTRICLTHVMHILGVDRNILSLKALDQKASNAIH